MTCLCCDGNDIVRKNLSRDLQIFVCIRIIQRWRTGIFEGFNYKCEADFVAVVDNGHHVLRVILTENKRPRIALRRERECERSRDLRIVSHDRGRGIPINIRATVYERNPEYRKACIEANGTKCKICAFDAGEIYGKDFSGRIHIHHIIPLGNIKKEHTIDPVCVCQVESA